MSSSSSVPAASSSSVGSLSDSAAPSSSSEPEVNPLLEYLNAEFLNEADVREQVGVWRSRLVQIMRAILYHGVGHGPPPIHTYFWYKLWMHVMALAFEMHLMYMTMETLRSEVEAILGDNSRRWSFNLVQEYKRMMIENLTNGVVKYCEDENIALPERTVLDEKAKELLGIEDYFFYCVYGCQENVRRDSDYSCEICHNWYIIPIPLPVEEFVSEKSLLDDMDVICDSQSTTALDIFFLEEGLRIFAVDVPQRHHGYILQELNEFRGNRLARAWELDPLFASFQKLGLEGSDIGVVKSHRDAWEERLDKIERSIMYHCVGYAIKPRERKYWHKLWLQLFALECEMADVYFDELDLDAGVPTTVPEVKSKMIEILTTRAIRHCESCGIPVPERRQLKGRVEELLDDRFNNMHYHCLGCDMVVRRNSNQRCLRCDHWYLVPQPTAEERDQFAEWEVITLDDSLGLYSIVGLHLFFLEWGFVVFEHATFDRSEHPIMVEEFVEFWKKRMTRGLKTLQAYRVDISTFMTVNVTQREYTDVCVCLMEYEEGTQVKRLPCGHVIHPDCLRRLICSAPNSKCPQCRRPIHQN